MRFAIVTETYPPEVNGVALTVQGLEQGLRGLGHTVDLVRPRQPGTPEPAHDGSLLVHGAPLPRYPGLRFGLPAGRRLIARWRTHRPDAIYVATEGPLGWSAVRTAKRLGIPATTGFHTRFDDYVERYGAGFLTPLVFSWLRRFHNGADATLVPTQELADFLHGNGFKRVELLRRAVDTTLFDPAKRDPALRAAWDLADDALAVIYVGRIAPEKNLSLAIRAFREIRQNISSRGGPDAKFIWVGDGPSRVPLAEANPDFIFCGVQRGDALVRHFASGDLFLFPSTTETFGNVTLEAMASGVATVAYDYGAAREHLRSGEHGFAIRNDDEEGFVAAALRLARDPALRARMGAAARTSVAHLDPGSVSQRFGELLCGLAQQRRAA